MADPFALDEDEEELTVLPAPRAEVVVASSGALTERDKRLRSLKDIEDEILEESSKVIRDALRFRDVEPDTEEPLPEWVEQFGREEAERMLRMAKAAHLNAKTAPVGFSIAKATMVGITKSRAAGDGARQLNIGISINMPAPIIDAIEVEGE